MTADEFPRRRVLTGIGSASVLGLTGCTSDSSPTTTGDQRDTADTTGPVTTTAGSTGADGASSEAPSTAAPDTTAMVRFAHLSATGPTVDAALFDPETDLSMPLASGVDFEGVSDYVDVPTGERRVTVRAADTDATDVYSDPVTLEADASYTAVALGTGGVRTGRDAFSVTLFEDSPAPDEDTASLRLVHASTDAPPVEVTADEGDTLLFDGLDYRESAATTVPAADYTLRVRPDSTGADAVASFDVSLDGGTAYTAFASGTVSPDDPEEAALGLVVAPVDR